MSASAGEISPSLRASVDVAASHLRGIGCHPSRFYALGEGNDAPDPRAAVACTILAGAKRHRLESRAYLRELILQVSVDLSPEFLETLLPDRWAAAHPEHVLSYRVEESREKARHRNERRAKRRIQSN